MTAIWACLGFIELVRFALAGRYLALVVRRSDGIMFGSAKLPEFIDTRRMHLLMDITRRDGFELLQFYADNKGGVK